jgi:tRNA A-37 threonylcarbamoyl transferase component Bud32
MRPLTCARIAAVALLATSLSLGIETRVRAEEVGDTPATSSEVRGASATDGDATGVGDRRTRRWQGARARRIRRYVERMQRSQQRPTNAAEADAPPTLEEDAKADASQAPLPTVRAAEAARRWAPRLEALLQRALDAAPPAWDPRIAAYMDWAVRPQGRRLGLAAAGGLLLTLLLMLRARRPGDLVIVLDYPAEFRGTFSVQLSKRRPAARRPSQGQRPQPRDGPSTRDLHNMVSRETEFKKLRPREYWVSVDGLLEDPESGSVLREPFEARPVEVRRRQTTRIEFDFQPRGCPVELKVLWDRQLAREASVSVLGRSDCLRYARNGIVRLELRPGQHRIAIGSGDRVAELQLEIDGFQPMSRSVDLSDTEHILFKGCPPAVGPYLLGDTGAAARALAREGQEELSHLLQARLCQASDQQERAAGHFEAAGCQREAAEIYASISNFSKAAALFEATGDHRKAAEMYRSAGELLNAGQSFEAVSDFDSAARCYREIGENTRLVDALERSGDSFEAARIACDHDDRSRAVRLLQQIGPNDPDYTDACMMLVDAYEQEGHYDLAAEKLETGIQAMAPEARTPELYENLARLLELSADPIRALEVLEELRLNEPSFPNIRARIEELRKKISLERQAFPSNAGPPTEPPGSRYEILEQIGRGGMGIVFKAQDRRLQRVVALKKLPENLRDHPTAVELFLREARAAAALNHPNIVTLFDADQDGETFFITMEFLEGVTLQTLVSRHRKLSPRDCARLGLQITAGLKYAHDQRIVHRDIKPANLFFTRDRVVKVMDFGLAKAIEEVRRATTVLGGTPYYMAPEQAGSEPVDPRTDIYALGVSFFQLVSGNLPFSDGDVAYHHRHTPPPDPREQVVGLPDAFAELILHMLEKDPEARCSSASEVSQRLEPIARS